MPSKYTVVDVLIELDNEPDRVPLTLRSLHEERNPMRGYYVAELVTKLLFDAASYYSPALVSYLACIAGEHDATFDSTICCGYYCDALLCLRETGFYVASADLPRRLRHQYLEEVVALCQERLLLSSEGPLRGGVPNDPLLYEEYRYAYARLLEAYYEVHTRFRGNLSPLDPTVQLAFHIWNRDNKNTSKAMKGMIVLTSISLVSGSREDRLRFFEKFGFGRQNIASRICRYLLRDSLDDSTCVHTVALISEYVHTKSEVLSLRERRTILRSLSVVCFREICMRPDGEHLRSMWDLSAMASCLIFTVCSRDDILAIFRGYSPARKVLQFIAASMFFITQQGDNTESLRSAVYSSTSRITFDCLKDMVHHVATLFPRLTTTCIVTRTVHQVWLPLLRLARNPEALQRVSFADWLETLPHNTGDTRFPQAWNVKHSWGKDAGCHWEHCLCSGIRPAHKLRICTGCFQVYYCNKECQRKDWNNGHREACGRSSLPLYWKPSQSLSEAYLCSRLKTTVPTALDDS
ncbi:hypothetical protein NM688_g8660 [Phlebia brevispora]|uniref:Uncharacterized protein n=1 Tax=Phlebia brevispora TaxID=194682 RepID=A0ACC1RPT4_9APHY|nr:hypothetical protein NM688_g8660 [Phlebia brevispora]